MDANHESKEATLSQCTVCNSRSTWDFLQEFYIRVAVAHQHSQRLESDLRYAATTVEQTRGAVIELERARAEIHFKLEEERLEHSVTRHEVVFEKQRHRETEKLFDLTYEAAQESIEIISCLRTQVICLRKQVTELQKRQEISWPTSATGVVDLQLTEDNLHLTQEKWKGLESWLSANSHDQ